MRYLSSRSQRRRGVVLLVVMAMLALFASVALSFVFYADAEAVAAKLNAQAQSKSQASIDPEALASYFLNQLIYDTDNVNSALRGWSLSRSMYGYNSAVLNYTPYNGIGRDALRYTDPIFNVDNFNLINYQKYFDPSTPGLNFERRPEWYGKLGDTNFRYVGGANAPWTAYDTNSLFLAQVDASGNVLMPSFYRPWINGGSDPNAAKHATLFPHASWNPQFVLPDATATGDVKCLEYGPGGNDSKWMNLGFPVFTAPNGKRYTVLFAPLVMDLSNRLQLWPHGNRLGTGNTPVSNLGIGATEVNLPRGLISSTDPQFAQKMAELQLLFDSKYGGTTGTTSSVAAGAPNKFQNGGPWWSPFDFDALDSDPNSKLSSKPPFMQFGTQLTMGVVADPKNNPVTAVVQNTYGLSTGGFPWSISVGMLLHVSDKPADPMAMDLTEDVTVQSVDHVAKSFVAPFKYSHAANVQITFGSSFRPFPYYWSGWDNQAASEITNSPLSLNPFAPVAPNIRAFPASHMEALLRYRGTNSPAVTSELMRRMPLTFSDIRARNMVTLESWHLDRIGAAPLAFDPRFPVQYNYDDRNRYATASGVTPVDYAKIAPSLAGTEYTSDWRSVLGSKLRVNLNRPLRDFPLPTLAPIQATEPNSKVIDLSVPANLTAYNAALQDRTDLAQDIYNALIRVTGAQDPNTLPGTSFVDPGAIKPTDANYKAARWLAQIAVNMVDYIDNDDYVTPFNWNQKAYVNAKAAADNAGANPTITNEYVYGTELPRLVLNEALAQFDNDLAGMATATTAGSYRLNLWLELLNPFDSTPTGATFPLDGGNAKLMIGADSVYQVVICKNSAAVTSAMRDPGNNLGDPDFNNSGASNVLKTVGDATNPWGTTATQREVLPVNGALGGSITPTAAATIAAAPNGAAEAVNTVTIKTTAAHGFTVGQVVTITGVTENGYNGTFTIASVPDTKSFTYTNSTAGLGASGAGQVVGYVGGNNGFYVLGPTPTYLPTRDSTITTTTAVSAMSVSVPAPSEPTVPTLLLRRLLVPHLPPNPATTGGAVNPALPYNPYITVDYLDNVGAAFVNDGRVYLDTGLNANAPGAVTGFKSYGRKHPYSAYSNPAGPSQVVAQAPATPLSGNPIHTFFQQNNPREVAFDWLVHLDRQPINPLEMRYVSGYKPHELTQQFIIYDNTNAQKKHQHRAPWNVQDTLLYRALDVLGTPNHQAGTFSGGRWPGSINLNTITEEEIFQALCDAQDANQISPLFTAAQVKSIYQKLLTSRNLPQGSSGLVPSGEGTPFQPFGVSDLRKTWLRPDPTTGTGQLFGVGGQGDHPYRRAALIQKLFNNVTTTSNMFAVWWTAGYFEVVDESVSPPRLGAEIGRAQNQHIRHRFFAIVDRSGLELFRTYGTGTGVAGKDQLMNIAAVSATYNNGTIPWRVEAGMLLEVDTGANREVVVVKAPPVDAGSGLFTITADFTLPHGPNVPIICRGNKGPNPNYNPRQDTGVVLHMSVIQ